MPGLYNILSNTGKGLFMSIGKQSGIPVSYISSLIGDAWADRVVSNGGTRPSQNSINAVNTFWNGILDYNLNNKMISVGAFAPDNLIASLTPIYYVSGSGLWTNYGFTSNDLTVNGLYNTSSNYLDTGITGNTFATNSFGISGYVFNNTASIGEQKRGYDYDIGIWNVNVTGSCVSLYLPNVNNIYETAIWDAWNAIAPLQGITQGRIYGHITSSYLPNGFYTANRTTVSTSSISFANSNQSFITQISTTSSVSIGSPPTGSTSIYVYAMNGTSSAAKKQYSFVAFHEGLQESELINLYNLVQAMRTSFGGGYL